MWGWSDRQTTHRKVEKSITAHRVWCGKNCTSIPTLESCLQKYFIITICNYASIAFSSRKPISCVSLYAPLLFELECQYKQKACPLRSRKQFRKATSTIAKFGIQGLLARYFQFVFWPLIKARQKEFCSRAVSSFVSI